MSLFRDTFMEAYRSRVYPNYWDLFALLIVFSFITMFAWNAKQMATPYQFGQVIPISLDTSILPFYAVRTVVRMLIAMVFSLLFTFIFGAWAAKSKRAERIIIPTIDILQTVPILGFLSVTVTGFIAMFPGSMLGPECAAIFAIFTSQAWNMALGFYQTVRTVPSEIEEAATMFHLTAWQRFWRIEVPFSMPGLLWNAMASMSAGWFFVVAAEALTVSNQDILLPGIGSYIAVAIQAADMHAILWAVIAMFIVILIYDQLLFRPLVAWAEKFKSMQVPTEKVPESWVINLLRRTRLIRKFGHFLAHLFDLFVNIRFSSSVEEERPRRFFINKNHDKFIGMVWDVVFILMGVGAGIFLLAAMIENISLSELLYVIWLGLITTLRVFILIVICSVIWVPIGVWIGLRPSATLIAQPIAQILAAFPANLFYPFIVIFIVTYHLHPDIWLTPLMILGAQWYILFNVVAGASQIPKDLLQAADNLGVSGWLRWSRLLLPSIFPYYITGAITAAGGAWNASIVAEVADWGNEKLVATGLGAYISEYTTKGMFAQTALGIGVMGILVLLINRLVWRPLYVLAENKYLME
ncbi:MAG TPA: ABC transporter permease subunit [Gammaproteobacteria bacterium]|jgi:NitT/TauT family transport system permease protein|nr:ABC transporter permease subunit [Gammaproteobacteria bacterium]